MVTSLKQVFHSILRSHKVKVWKHAIESELDIFMTHAEAYAIEEFDIMTSLLEGGDFLGLGVGNHGITNDKKLPRVCRRAPGGSPPQDIFQSRYRDIFYPKAVAGAKSYFRSAD